MPTHHQPGAPPGGQALAERDHARQVAAAKHRQFVERTGGPPQFTESASSTSLENFLSTFHTNEGYAQPNRYEVEIFPPPKTIEEFPNMLGNRSIQLRCESIILPGRNLSSSPDTNVHGPLREVVDNVNYADSIAMVFQASADLRERVFFEKWQYAAFNQETWNVGYYNDYIGHVDIYLLDKQNKRKYGLKIVECFPKSITQTDLSYASNNEIIKISIDMNFRYWETLDTTQKSKRGRQDFHHRNLTISRARPAAVRKLDPVGHQRRESGGHR